MPARHRDWAPRTVKLPDGGDAILVEGQPPYPAPFLDLRAGRTNETWQPFGVTVEDTGSGMSEETQSRMFDLFFTTKPQGTGLGMAIARSVIDLHGGELTIHSVLGHGTRVSVRLPVEPQG